MATSAYDRLHSIYYDIQLLESTSLLLTWDNETNIPDRGSAHRGEQLAQLAGMIHERSSSSELGDLLAVAEKEYADHDPFCNERVNLREWRFEYERLTKLPIDLVRESKKATVQGRKYWLIARDSNDFTLFAPYLQRIFELKRREAEYYGYESEPYEALFALYEPDIKIEYIQTVLSQLRDELKQLVQDVQKSPVLESCISLEKYISTPVQKEFIRKITAQIGFDYQSGHLDIAPHPFCMQIGPGDTRLTTRFDENFFPSALFSSLHEAGHGLYEQNLPEKAWGSPLGNYVSLSVHESQSRLWENMVGRSRVFWEYWLPIFQEDTKAYKDVTLDEFHLAINRSKPSFIRVEADELTYNLHILIRFELERALINGTLETADLPYAWNEKYREYLGINVPDDTNGCLQDIHWCTGLIGYFPTYSLGNLIAAQFYNKIKSEHPEIEDDYKTGRYDKLRDWLQVNVHSKGMTYRTGDLVERITGEKLTANYLLDYLKSKYGKIYKL